MAYKHDLAVSFKPGIKMGVAFFILFALVTKVYSIDLELKSLNIDQYVIYHVHVTKASIIMSLRAIYKPTDQMFSPVVRFTLTDEELNADFFPNKELYIPSNNCSGINNAVATTSDLLGRVYILDSSLKCHSKIIISSFVWKFMNLQIPIFDKEISPKSILALNKFNPIIIVGVSNKNIILACTVAKDCEDLIVKAPLQDSMENNLKSTEVMAISPDQGKIFMTSNDQEELFSVKIKDIHKIANHLSGVIVFKNVY